MMLNIIKLLIFSYLTIIGLFTTFGIVWLKCVLMLTKEAVTLLVVLSAVVDIPYILWMVRWE
jgi:hypothetical protein